jgi:hypothetical protein
MREYLTRFGARVVRLGRVEPWTVEIRGRGEDVADAIRRARPTAERAAAREGLIPPTALTVQACTPVAEQLTFLGRVVGRGGVPTSAETNGAADVPITPPPQSTARAREVTEAHAQRSAAVAGRGRR